MEVQEGTIPVEKGNPTEIVIFDDLLVDIAKNTKQKSLENSGEFLFFIMDNGKEQIEVPVGVGYQYGVAYTPEMAIKSLKPYINEGFKILADYHNHTPESVKIYQERGLPAEYAFSPSFGDINSDIPSILKSELKQDDYPHLIGIYLEGSDTVYINGFEVNRTYSKSESDEVEFEDPFYKEEAPDNFGIKLLAGKYTDPPRLIEKGIVSSIRIKTDSNEEIPNIKLNTPIE